MNCLSTMNFSLRQVKENSCSDVNSPSAVEAFLCPSPRRTQLLAHVIEVLSALFLLATGS